MDLSFFTDMHKDQAISTAGLCVVALLVLCISHWIHKWRNHKCNGVLPPGSMGVPITGETLQSMIPSSSLDVPPFIKKRLQRYGPIFLTSVAGRPLVVSADIEFNHFILQQEGKLVESWFLDSSAAVFKTRKNSPDGAYNKKYMRNLTSSHFGAETLKSKLMVQMEELMAIHFGAKQLFGYDPEKSSLDLTQTYINISNNLLAFPVNIPGTTYYKSLKNRKKVVEIMKDILHERLASPETPKGDVLDHIIGDMRTENFLTEDFVAQQLFGLLYVTFESVSVTITMAFKLLAGNPTVLEELTAEHQKILNKRGKVDSPLTWEEYKSMTFTRYVINEILRLGYTIPAGWGIMVATSALQLDPNTFENPLAFSPWRWKHHLQDLKPDFKLNYFMPFGGGVKQCAGADYSRILLSILLHVLVTKYRMKKIDGGDVVRAPTLKFKTPFHIKISKKNN